MVRQNHLDNGTLEKLSAPEQIEASAGMQKFQTGQTNNLKRVALAESIGPSAEDVKKSGIKNMLDRAENRTPELLHESMKNVLTPARIDSLDPSGVRLWTTGGNAIVEIGDGRGYKESGGNSEVRRMKNMYERMRNTANWQLGAPENSSQYLRMNGTKLELNRAMLEDDLVYVSDKKRYLQPKGDPEKAADQEARAALFMRYKETLLDLLEATGDPRKEMEYVNRHGSVAPTELLRRHTYDYKGAKDVMKFMALGGVALLFGINALNDFRHKRFRVMTLALLGGVVGLAGKNSNFNILTNSRFVQFSQENISKEMGNKIFNLRGSKMSALLSYFRTHKTKVMTEKDMQYLIEPKDSKGKPRMDRAVPSEIANIFVGMKGVVAYNYLKGMKKLGTDKSKGQALEFFDANYTGGDEVANDIRKMANDPALAAAAVDAGDNT